MTNQNKWEEFYKNTPLEKISWLHAPWDYLSETINSGKIKPGTALDLGCGMGTQSIFLAKHGFDVTGVDISQTAIDYALTYAKKENVQINFMAKDATDLNFLNDKKFDLILDWTNLHGIPIEKRMQYIQEIEKHTEKGTKLILRCFGRKEGEKESVTRPMAVIHFFTIAEIKNIYSKYFKITEINTSDLDSETAPTSIFHEFLMERI
jgi:2-polyprenyl-3-methyl-5-hydroxy-6-metoxy-1,4-benzoquinol methylase